MSQEFPGLFGGVARSRILFSLVLDGPQTRRGLARSLGIDPTFALQRLRSLERAELVTRDETVSDFNWASPIARETVCVVSRYARRQCPLFPLVEESALGEGHLQIFGSPTRTKLLLAVARLKHASLGELAAEAGVTLDAARAAADALKRAGVLEIDLCRNRRIVNLDPDQLGFSEVAALLEALNCAAATRR